MRAKDQESRVRWNTLYHHFITSHSRPLGRIVNSIHGDSTEGLEVHVSPQSNSQDTERVRKRICPALSSLPFPTGQVSSHEKLTLCLLGNVSRPLYHFSRSLSCTPQCGVLLKSSTEKVIWHGGRSIYKLMRERERERKLRESKKAKKIYVPIYVVIAYPLGKVISLWPKKLS